MQISYLFSSRFLAYFQFSCLVILLSTLLFGCGGGGGGSSNDISPIDTSPIDVSPAAETFTNSGFELTASTVEANVEKITTVTGADGEVALTLRSTITGVIIDFPGFQENTEIVFSTPLADEPSTYATNRLATFIAGQLLLEPSAAQTTTLQVRGQSLRLQIQDAPGCDWFPDTQCTLGCCAQHDACFDENNCSANSWLPGFGSTACNNCNSVVANCISQACSGDVQSDTTDRCYDNRCGARYDCGGANCDCASPCDSSSPASCGNGSCEVGEDASNCVSDCAQGDGINQCCVANNGCPSETPTTCPGSCCCCGFGEVCGSGDLCVSTGNISPANRDYEPSTPNPTSIFRESLFEQIRKKRSGEYN